MRVRMHPAAAHGRSASAGVLEPGWKSSGNLHYEGHCSLAQPPLPAGVAERFMLQWPLLPRGGCGVPGFGSAPAVGGRGDSGLRATTQLVSSTWITAANFAHWQQGFLALLTGSAGVLDMNEPAHSPTA